MDKSNMFRQFTILFCLLSMSCFPPVFAAVANALYKATGKRYYDQPFGKQIETNPSRL